ncbi:MAG TPA: flagellar regulator YcgR PilZN domain-containing protein, partial [Rhodanobacteraceae bacterium]
IAARCPVFVFIEGDEERYATVLLEIDAAARALIVDELLPKHGHRRMRRGAKLKLASRLDGVDVRFRSAVCAVDADSQVAAYMLDLPEALDYREQRSSRRTRTFEVTAELRDEQGEPIPARVLDLSIEGIRLCVPAPHPFGEAARCACTVWLPGGAIEAALAILRVRRALERPLRGAAATDVLGARFEALGDGDARRLGRDLADTQRALMRARRATTENLAS